MYICIESIEREKKSNGDAQEWQNLFDRKKKSAVQNDSNYDEIEIQNTANGEMI